MSLRSISDGHTDRLSASANLLHDGIGNTFVSVERRDVANRYQGTMDAFIRPGAGLRARERMAMEIDLGRVLDALPAMVWTALPDGHIDFVNRRWSEYTGLAWTKPMAGSGRPRSTLTTCPTARTLAIDSGVR